MIEHSKKVGVGICAGGRDNDDDNGMPANCKRGEEEGRDGQRIEWHDATLALLEMTPHSTLCFYLLVSSRARGCR